MRNLGGNMRGTPENENREMLIMDPARALHGLGPLLIDWGYDASTARAKANVVQAVKANRSQKIRYCCELNANTVMVLSKSVLVVFGAGCAINYLL